MIVSSATWSVAQFPPMIKNNSLDLNHPLQRGDVWNVRQKEMLIRSLFMHLPVPAVFVIKDTELFPNEKTSNTAINRVIDGKQRLLSIIQFYNNEVKVAPNTIYIDPSNEKHDISGKLFSDLDVSIQSNFAAMPVPVCLLSECTHNEIEDLIIAYNNGKAMTKKQTMKLQIGLQKTIEFNSFMLNNEFFQYLFKHMTNAQKNANEDFFRFNKSNGIIFGY